MLESFGHRRRYPLGVALVRPPTLLLKIKVSVSFVFSVAMPGAREKQIRQLTRDEQIGIIDTIREGATAADSWQRINASRRTSGLTEVHETTVHRYASGQTHRLDAVEGRGRKRSLSNERGPCHGSEWPMTWDTNLTLRFALWLEVYGFLQKDQDRVGRHFNFTICIWCRGLWVLHRKLKIVKLAARFEEVNFSLLKTSPNFTIFSFLYKSHRPLCQMQIVKLDWCLVRRRPFCEKP